MTIRGQLLIATGIAAILLSTSVAAADVDASAAKKLARKESCLRCHAVNKKKEGPAYESIAYKYKGHPEAADKLIDHITSGEKVKLSDGHEENHEIVKTKDPGQIRNLIEWILSR
jgi:cytochrome c